MTKKIILQALRSAIANAPVGSFGHPLQPIPLTDARPHSRTPTIDWLTENFKKNNATLEISSVAKLAEKVTQWAQKKTRNAEIYIHNHDPHYCLLAKKLANSKNPLTLYRVPQLSQVCAVASIEAVIAETGTLVAHATHVDTKDTQVSQPTSLHYVCDHYCAIVLQQNIYRYMEDYWEKNIQNAAKQRSIHFISGPSRTGDIEQTIEIGAHGPLTVHLIIVR